MERSGVGSRGSQVQFVFFARVPVVLSPHVVLEEGF